MVNNDLPLAVRFHFLIKNGLTVLVFRIKKETKFRNLFSNTLILLYGCFRVWSHISRKMYNVFKHRTYSWSIHIYTYNNITQLHYIFANLKTSLQIFNMLLQCKYFNVCHTHRATLKDRRFRELTHWPFVIAAYIWIKIGSSTTLQTSSIKFKAKIV